MSFMTGPLDRKMATEIGDNAAEHDVRLTLSIYDQDALWDAAATRLRSAGLADEEIADCIGSPADISLKDCLTTLILPLTLAGCKLSDIVVREVLPDLGDILLAAAQATSHIGAGDHLPLPRFLS